MKTQQRWYVWQDTGGLPGEHVAIEVAQQVPDIDVVLAGHSHLDVLKAVINDVVIAEPPYCCGKTTFPT